MDQYSELVGSFLRNAAFPLEADYVFESEEALCTFYEKPENKAIIHQGWFKIVGKGDNQALYWVVKEGDDLKFVKLIEKIDRNSIYSNLKELSEKINDEIRQRKEADEEIWGDKEGVISDLNNIEELSKAVDELRTKMGEAINALSTMAKGDNSLELEEIEDYLKQLDYPSIKDLSETLYKFLNEIDESDEKINTFPELQEFLDGYKDTDKLRDVLQNLSNSILGNVDPGTTLESLRRHLLDLIQALNNRCHNLQTELDQTQVGVGLSGDGAYNPDKETYYLQDAKSVMNALKTLDRILHRINNILFTDTDSVKFDSKVDEDTNSNIVTADVRISPESDIIIKSDGIYHKVSLKEENGVITLYVNGEIRDQFDLGISSFLEDGYYDEHIEKLILIFKLLNSKVQRVEIPVDKLITEWEPGNTLSITLNKSRVIDGPDVLTANLNVSEDIDNGISVKSDGVFVSKNAKDLIYKEKSVEAVIEDLETSVELVEETLLDYEADKAIIPCPKSNQIVYTTIDCLPLGMDVNNAGKIGTNNVISDVYYHTFGIVTYEKDVTESPAFREVDIERVKSVVFPSADRFRIGLHCFNGAINLESVVCPKLVSIGGYAFKDCRKLKDIELPEGIESIGDYGFENCSSLEKINLPEGLLSISNFAFVDCKSLKSLEVPSTTTSVGSQWVKRCNNLTRLTIKGSIESDDVNFLLNTPVLEDIDISQTKLPAFYCGSPIKTLKLPNTIKKLNLTYSLFTSLNIPNTVETISGYGFAYNHNLISVTIPGSVKTIGDNPFRDCYNLRYMKIDCTVPFGNSQTYQRPSPVVIDTRQSTLGADIGSPDRLEKLILRSNTVVKDLDTYLATPTQSEESEVMPVIDLDEWIKTPNNWLKIYVPSNKLSEYKETYPTLKNYFHPITGNDIYALEEDLEEVRQNQAEDLAKITDLQGKLNGIENVQEELDKKARAEDVPTLQQGVKGGEKNYIYSDPALPGKGAIAAARYRSKSNGKLAAQYKYWGDSDFNYDTEFPVATKTSDGVMSAADKVKLEELEEKKAGKEEVENRLKWRLFSTNLPKS